MYNFSTQSIGLDSLFNARELGGYVLPGGTVRKGTLLRGGSLAMASFSDLQKLGKVFHLSHIFDFRTSNEVEKNPDRAVDGARYLWLPAFDEDSQQMEETSLPAHAYKNLVGWCVEHAAEENVQALAKGMYNSMVTAEFTQVQYAGFLQNVLNAPSDGAVYWHCSQGKDRTGLGAAFIMGALGASRELILTDFAISNEFYADMVAEACSKVNSEAEREVMRTFIGVNVKYFTAALDLIDQQWGSLHNYLVDALMFSENDMAALRAKYLE